MPDADLLPIGEAARLLGVHPETLRRWERAGKIKATRTLGDGQGGQRRFRRADLEAITKENDDMTTDTGMSTYRAGDAE